MIKKSNPASPLQGKRVLVTRPAHQAGELMTGLRALGAEPISFPTIEIRPVEDTHLLDQAIRRLEGYYNWLILTSANGVTALWERLDSLGFNNHYLASVKIAAIGPATATALNQRGVEPDLTPEVYTAEGILAAFDQLGSIAGQRFLLTRADIARKALAEGLMARGAQVEEIAAYRTIPVAGGSPPPPADIVTFTSSSTVQGYVNCLGPRSPAEALNDSQVVCIGPITAATAQALGLPVHAVAEVYTVEGLLEALKSLGVLKV